MGIADVSEVPSALHNAFERRFRKLRSQPVVPDWKGEVTKPLLARPGQANGYLNDRGGRMAPHYGGEASGKRLGELFQTLSRLGVEPVERMPFPEATLQLDQG